MERQRFHSLRRQETPFPGLTWLPALVMTCTKVVPMGHSGAKGHVQHRTHGCLGAFSSCRSRRAATSPTWTLGSAGSGV